MNIEIMPLVDLNSVHDEICEHDGCGYRPEIGISIYKRKRKDEMIGEHIKLYLCRNHYYQLKEQFLNKDNRLNKYYELLDKKEKEITYLNIKMVSGQELEDTEE